MTITIGEPPQNPANLRNNAIFALGFRPFFLLAGISAVLLIGLWVLIWQGKTPVTTSYFPAVSWHAHEMLFGYTVAVIAGFLLTAVRNWTGIDTPTGIYLALLALVWLAGRLAIAIPGLPYPLVALLDLLFIPLLAISLIRPLWQGQNKVNRVFLLLFAGMAIANLLVHLEPLGFQSGLSGRGYWLMLDSVLLVLLLVAGRVLPFFTEKAVRAANVVRRPWVEKLSFISMTLLMLAEFIWPASGLAGGLALITALIQGIRLAGWHDFGVWRNPILWVLFSGYLWLIIGLLLRGVSGFELAAPNLGLHALTIGAVGVMTLGMMARVALGHTGRVLQARPIIHIAFILLNLAAFLRVFLPMFWPTGYAASIWISGGLWIIAFAVFSLIYTPILIKPRVDGRPG